MIKADIPQDIREYKEQFFFGLNLRQLICAVLMILLSVGTFLICHNFIRTDILMYILVAEAAPLAAAGFLKYNGMTAEKFIWAWIKSTFMIPKVLTFGNTNYYFSMLEEGSTETAKKRCFHRRGSRQKRKMIRKKDTNSKRQKKEKERS